MSILVFGLNHKTTSLSLREKAYFAPEKLSLYLQDMLSCRAAEEIVLLSTCNRSEIYCETNDFSAVRAWFLSQTKLTESELQSCSYVYHDETAVKHIMQVAAGLDSMILGEPQILGQMKEAYSESCAAGAVGALFHRLFQQVFSAAKEIRTSTAIGACPVSVASAAVNFAKKQLAEFAHSRVLLLGAGDTTQLILRYLAPQLSLPATLINRDLEKAKVILSNGHVFGLDHLCEQLVSADVVFSATGSPIPLITKKMMQEVMQKRMGKPIILIDVAVPRDIDPSVSELPEAHLFCIDDLKNIIEHNRQGREHAANKAHEMISERARAFMNDIQSIDKIAHAISAYRSQIEKLCRAELLKAKQQLLQGDDPQKVLETFAHAYTNKLLHAPSVSLRQAGQEGRFEILRFAKQLFAINDHELERL